MSSFREKPVVAVAGPTASGKSELALRLAEEFGGEIVNCDSLQLYRHFDIGTAKLPEAKRRGIAHHLLDVLEPGEICSAGRYMRLARETVSGIHSRGRMAIVAGGTGFYLRAFLHGLAPGPGRDAPLRDQLTRRAAARAGLLWRYLRRLDGASAARIHRNDTPKLVRAIEVCLLTRQPQSALHAGGREPAGYDAILFGLDPPREALKRAIDQRTLEMFQTGLIEEVRALVAAGCESSWAFGALGYRQALAVLRDQMSEAEALADTQLRTRQYAKRQLTWFRKEPEMIWLRGFGSSPELAEAASRHVRQTLRFRQKS